MPLPRYTLWLALSLVAALCVASPLLAQSNSSRLVLDLKAKDAASRRQAANQLGAARARDAVRPLVDALTDADVTVREAAAFALGQIADPSASEPLIRLLKDKDAAVRSSSAFALGMIGDRKAIEPISRALDDADPATRSSAIVALGLMQDEAAVDELIAALHDPSYDVRYDAVWALGQIGEPDAESHLRASLVSLDSLRVSDSLREAFRQAVQYSLDNLRTEEHARATAPPSRPRLSTDRSTRGASVRQTVQAAATERALRERAGGSVGVRVLVEASGRPVRVYVVRRLSYGLDQRAVEAVLQYRFDPATQAGLPQSTWVDLDVKF